jgi:hypothetical protein
VACYARGHIFSRVQPFHECAVSNLDPQRSMHRPVEVAHSSFIEGSHMTKNTASGIIASLKNLDYPKRQVTLIFGSRP